MNHYQKVATVLIRAAGITAVALGVFGLLYGVGLMVRGVQLTAEQADRFGASVLVCRVRSCALLARSPAGPSGWSRAWL